MSSTPPFGPVLPPCTSSLIVKFLLASRTMRSARVTAASAPWAPPRAGTGTTPPAHLLLHLHLHPHAQAQAQAQAQALPQRLAPLPPSSPREGEGRAVPSFSLSSCFRVQPRR